MGNCHLQRPATDHLKLEAPVIISLPTLLHYGVEEHRATRSCAGGIAYAQSHEDGATGNHQSQTREGRISGQRCPSSYTSKRLVQPCAPRRNAWRRSGIGNCNVAGCCSINLPWFDGGGNNGEPISRYTSRLTTGMGLPAAHPSRSPTLIGLEALLIGTSNWRDYRNRACVRFHFSHLPSLLFTSMRSPLRYMAKS